MAGIMNTTAAADPVLHPTPNHANSPVHRIAWPRLWPAIVIVVLFWAVIASTRIFEIAMLTRFLTRLVALALLLIASLAWWLTRRTISWRDRIASLAVVAALGTISCLLADRSVKPLGMFMSTLPIVVTAWVLWLIVAKSQTSLVQRLGFCLLMLGVFTYFTLLRFDGLDSLQRSETSWRWQPTKEQVFLAAHTKEAAAAAADPETKSWTVQPGDCAEYRGTRRDGVVANLSIREDWEANPPKELWRKKVGPSWSGIIVVDGHLVTQEQRGDLEVVVCCDAATGEEQWVHENKVRFEESLSGAGPRGTPTFVDGRIFALGGKGNLNCLDAMTGKVIWAHDIVADAGVKPGDMPQWGYSVSPLVVDSLVVVFAGGGDKSVLAYRVDNGELAWSAPGGKQSYSSPQLVELHGERQILMHDNKALRSLAVADGKQLWELAGSSDMALPMLQPHQIGTSNELIVSTEPGAVFLTVKKAGDGSWSVERKWDTNRFRPGFNDFVLHDGFLYGLDDGIMCAFDLSNGERVWKKGRIGHGQVLVLPEQNVLVASSNRGDIVLVAADPKAYRELARFEAIEGKTWNSPVIDGQGRVYLRNGEEMAAYDLGVRQPPSDASASSN